MIGAATIRVLRGLERRRAFGERHVRRLLRADDFRWRGKLCAAARARGAGFDTVLKIMYGGPGLYNRSLIEDFVPAHSLLQSFTPGEKLPIVWSEVPITNSMYLQPIRIRSAS